MYQSVEQVVKDHLAAARKTRRANRDPAEARAFLLRTGVYEPVKKSRKYPSGLRLAKRFR